MEDINVKFAKTLLLNSIIIFPLLTGCGQFTQQYEQKKAEIEEYNTLVIDTLASFTKAKTFAESQQTNLEDYIFENEYFPTLVDAGIVTPNLTEEQIDLFNYRSILDNDYYTSLGSSTARQVMTIKGKENHMMYVKIIWSENGIIDFKREVRQQ